MKRPKGDLGMEPGGKTHSVLYFAPIDIPDTLDTPGPFKLGQGLPFFFFNLLMLRNWRIFFNLNFEAKWL